MADDRYIRSNRNEPFICLSAEQQQNSNLSCNGIYLTEKVRHNAGVTSTVEVYTCLPNRGNKLSYQSKNYGLIDAINIWHVSMFDHRLTRFDPTHGMGQLTDRLKYKSVVNHTLRPMN